MFAGLEKNYYRDIKIYINVYIYAVAAVYASCPSRENDGQNDVSTHKLRQSLERQPKLTIPIHARCLNTPAGETPKPFKTQIADGFYFLFNLLLILLLRRIEFFVSIPLRGVTMDSLGSRVWRWALRLGSVYYIYKYVYMYT